MAEFGLDAAAGNGGGAASGLGWGRLGDAE